MIGYIMDRVPDIQRTRPAPLRAFRVAQGFRQEDLAALASCSRKTIIALEKGEQKPRLATALRIAEVLEAPVEKVFPPEAEATE